MRSVRWRTSATDLRRDDGPTSTSLTTRACSERSPFLGGKVRSRGSIVELAPRWHTGDDCIYMPIGCHSTARLSSREDSVAPRAEGGELPLSRAELQSVRPSERNPFRSGNAELRPVFQHRPKIQASH